MDESMIHIGAVGLQFRSSRTKKVCLRADEHEGGSRGLPMELDMEAAGGGLAEFRGGWGGGCGALHRIGQQKRKTRRAHSSKSPRHS